MTTVTTRLQIDGVCVHRAGVEVLYDVSLQLSGGELLVLLGANGSGKTTLLGAISGELPLTRGAVLLDGRHTCRLPARERARRIAVVPQTYELPAGFTVGELVAMARHPHVGLLGVPDEADADAVRRALCAVELERVAAKPVQTLSGGERQMAVLAMALAQVPDLLLLDEPTNHLDLRREAEIMAAVRAACAARGVAALAVVHDVRLARRYADRVALLRGGRLLVAGEPDDVLDASTLASCYGVERAFVDGLGLTARPHEGGPG